MGRGLSNGLTKWPIRPARKETDGETLGEWDLPLAAIEPRRLYRQIADQLRQLIDDGEYPVGSRLPTERELAEKLGVSRPTVREALIALEVEGRLRIRVGFGHLRHRPARHRRCQSRSADRRLVRDPARPRVRGERGCRGGRPPGHASPMWRGSTGCWRKASAASARATATSCSDRGFHTAIAATLENAVLVRFVGELFDLRINPYFEQLAQLTARPELPRAGARGALRDPRRDRRARSGCRAGRHARPPGVLAPALRARFRRAAAVQTIAVKPGRPRNVCPQQPERDSTRTSDRST